MVTKPLGLTIHFDTSTPLSDQNLNDHIYILTPLFLLPYSDSCLLPSVFFFPLEIN